MLLAAVTLATSTRRAADAAIDRQVAAATIRLATPAWWVTAPDAWRVPAELLRAPSTSLRHAVELMTHWRDPPLDPIDVAGLQRDAEFVIAQRDGIVIAIAVESYRRQHDALPTTLDALVPALLPALPLDRITGDPLRYRVIDNAPVIYSVGVDRDDDGGRAPVDREGKPASYLAARWTWDVPNRPAPDGDWILYDGRLSQRSGDE